MLRNPRPRAAHLVLVLLTAITPVAYADEAAKEVVFNRDIRPILSNNCFFCHGPDENERQADLRLDVRDEALAPRDGKPAIVPGKPEASELISRIHAEDDDIRMPPADSGKALTEEQRELLNRWVRQGAEYQSHWAYLAPEPVEPPPSTKHEQPIDRFVAARLASEGWTLSPAADARTLIRRLSFDLTGLPPTAQEVEAFVADPTPQAYTKLVDRLLASKHFGERLAVDWLDAVRYADTNGIHGDNHREHWLFRDYVIASFNNNKPFDVFTREQLAGDLMPNATREQRIASGYNRLNMTTREGGAQAKEYIAKYAADRVRNASTVWLGSTMGCSECHDHKFDPFSQQDFYQFAAFFADIEETPVGVQRAERMPTPEQQKELADLDASMKALQVKLDSPTPELEAAQRAWEKQLRESQVVWNALKAESLKTVDGVELKQDEELSIRASGQNPDKADYSITTMLAKTATALRLEVLPDPSAPAKGPGRAGNGNFVVTEFQVWSGEDRIELAAARATHSQQGWADAAAIDGNPDTGWAVLPHVGKPNSLVLEAKDDIPAGPLKIVIQQNHGRGSHTLARFRIAATAHKRPVAAQPNGLPGDLETIFNIDEKQRTAEQQAKLAKHYRTVAPLLQPARKELEQLKRKRQSVENASPALLVAKSINPRTMRVLPRGNWLDDSGREVSPSTPSFLPSMPEKADRANRLDLAEWIIDSKNPLTARVFVNRLWKLAFGTGIVRTPEDFGSQGEWPTHPQLLDWLAIDFVNSGWDVKRAMKQIVMSETYRQTSRVSPEMMKGDPLNRLLGRQNRFRLDAEFVRDNAMAVSGLLIHRVGGPSVKPYQPFGYWSHLNFPKRVYKPDDGENQYRRGLYTYWCRTFLHPSMLAFDAPTREECSVQRPRSNTPLAALVLLNDPTYVEAARAMAVRILKAHPEGTTAERLRFLFAESLHRPPTDLESETLTALVEHHRTQYENSPEQAKEVQQNGAASAFDAASPAEQAAWVSAVRVVFNLHEFINRN